MNSDTMSLHPSPQFAREAIIDLDGIWDSSLGKIRVPYCPESQLSGIGRTDFIREITYTREMTIPAEWQGKRIMLHFEGVDYSCIVTVDGREIGRHTGGATAFSMDITSAVQAGRSQRLTVAVIDDMLSGLQATGKQSQLPGSEGCVYTRVTGIWGQVWLEAMDTCALKSCRITPDVDGGAIIFQPIFYEIRRGQSLTIEIGDGRTTLCSRTVTAQDGVPVAMQIASPLYWSPRKPFLYSVTYVVKNDHGQIIDTVSSYAGLRKVHLEDGRVYLNNQPIFLRMVLDQEYYPDGLWTPPDDAALRRDIELALQAGFNGARLHQKVFSERFYYWADTMGYLVWSEFPDWGINFWQHFPPHMCPADYQRGFRDYLAQWREVLESKVNHPSIIAWTPLNETEDYLDWEEHRRIVREVYEMTKAFDPTRPVNDTSGYSHVRTDLWTVHPYHQDPKELDSYLRTQPVAAHFPDRELAAYDGQPYIVDEYGGVKYIPQDRRPYADNSWGYGQAPKDLQEALQRMEALTDVLIGNPRIAGYCYTQLTDIEQEQNGIYNYDRSEKFPMEVIRKIFSKTPEWSFWK